VRVASCGAPIALEDWMTDQGGRLVVSVPEAARMLGVSRTLGYELVARGELGSVRLGRRIVVPLAAIEQLLASAVNGPQR
jgi:excisionase family DNA binding protein